MSVRNAVKSIAAAAVMTVMPIHAASASPASSLSVAGGLRADAALQGENNQLEDLSAYIVPLVIVIALGIGLYFVLDDEDESVSS